MNAVKHASPSVCRLAARRLALLVRCARLSASRRSEHACVIDHWSMCRIAWSGAAAKRGVDGGRWLLARSGLSARHHGDYEEKTAMMGQLRNEGSQGKGARAPVCARRGLHRCNKADWRGGCGSGRGTWEAMLGISFFAPAWCVWGAEEGMPGGREHAERNGELDALGPDVTFGCASSSTCVTSAGNTCRSSCSRSS